MSVKIVYFVHGTTTDNEEHKSTGQKQAIEQDWRKTKNWQPGWIYEIKE